jgi:hypothetical protein
MKMSPEKKKTRSEDMSDGGNLKIGKRKYEKEYCRSGKYALSS